MKKFLFLLAMLFLVAEIQSQEIFKETLKLMGSRFDITVVADDKPTATIYIQDAINEIKRIENLISSWDPNSQTSEINRNAGIRAVNVDRELFDLIARSLSISKITDGAFDISYASMDKVWFFDGSMTEMPSKATIANSVSKVGFNNIVLDGQTNSVFLKLEGMKIGFGAIGKGYAADKAKELLIKKGVVAGIINASGDMNTWGFQPNGGEWKIAITNPFDKNKSYGLFPLNKGAVVTSGNYEKFIEFNGKRFSHIINPKTGYPATGIVSVTVFAPKAELADALATSVFVMGIEVGLHVINQLSNIECIIVEETGTLHTSKNIKIEKS